LWVGVCPGGGGGGGGGGVVGFYKTGPKKSKQPELLLLLLSFRRGRRVSPKFTTQRKTKGSLRIYLATLGAR